MLLKLALAKCPFCSGLTVLKHWDRVTQICVSKFTIIASDNGLLPIRRQAVIWTSTGILLIRTLGTNFSEILIQIHTFSNKKMHLKMSSGKCRPFCLGLSVLTPCDGLLCHCVKWTDLWPREMSVHKLIAHDTRKFSSPPPPPPPPPQTTIPNAFF